MSCRLRFVSAGMLIILFTLVAGHADPAAAADWPMWRYDAGRTAASPTALPEQLHLQWVRQYAARELAWDDPLNQDLMTYDRLLEPIVVGGRLLIGFNDQDKISALNATTGEHLWDFYTDGPVRLPLAASADSVYCASDDGLLYCVDLDTGVLKWSRRGGPGEQLAIGNQRVISAWPARGGPVLKDDNVYFAASIWPFMGIFIYCLDAETGNVVWVNDEAGSIYIRQPHSAPSFAGVGPQGALVATSDSLVVPGGRSVPAVFDRQTGVMRYFEINAGGKGTGGSFVAANDDVWFVHTRFKGTREFLMDSGLKTAFMPNEPVLTAELTYSAEEVQGQPVIRAYERDRAQAWQVPADGRGDLILAGDILYAASGSSEGAAAADSGTITAVRLPQGSQPAQIIWTLPVPGQVERLIAASDMLFAVTIDGQLLAFGASPVHQPPVLALKHSQLTPDADAAKKAAELLAAELLASELLASELLASGGAEGYAFWFGAADQRLLEAMAAVSPFVQLSIIDPDAERVSSLRQQLDAAGLYGRVTAHQSTAATFRAPKYVANMIFAGREAAAGLLVDRRQLDAVYGSVRPYGGALHLLTDAAESAVAADRVRSMELEQADVQVTPHGVLIRRVGALPGSADWTHKHGNIANTIKSDDQRVRLPLGILWFGGNSNLDVLPRHGHGPPQQVVAGRLIIQGMNSLSARDVYTGRVLWKREFEDLGTYGVYYDDTYQDRPLDTAYNQIHIPGSNARGTNYVVTDDRIYVVEGSVCRVLEPATGEILQTITMPQENPDEPYEWGFIGVYEDILIGGMGFARYQSRLELAVEEVDGEVVQKRAVFGSRSLDRAGSMALVGFDRHTGEPLWKRDAVHSFWHNGVVAGNGRVYALDKNPKQIEEALLRRGRSRPDTYRILCFDARTGDTVWETTDGIFGTWLGYSEQHDLLLQAGAAASDRMAAEVNKGMTVYHGRDGSIAWKKDSLTYSGPCILHNDLIITNANSYSESAGAFHLRDGSQKMVRNPLTGKMQPWKITRAYGCNTILASEHLLTFRSGAAGFYDLLTESGTGNLGGFKSGCTSNLIAANGVLNAPDYTRTCSCAYQNQTSLALVHMPDLDLELWTVDNAAVLKSTADRIQQIGINLGAPGDRRDPATGLGWLEYPIVAGDSPSLDVQFHGPAATYQSHPATMQGATLPWVVASGVEGIHGVRVGLFAEKQDTLAGGLPVSHSDDDAAEQADGSVSLTGSELQLAQDSAGHLIGLRFEDIHLGRHAEVRSAFLQFTCREVSEEPAELIIRAELSASGARFTDRSRDLSARPLTNAYVVWTPAAWKKIGDAGASQRTPDLSAVIREVISQDGWKPGQAMVFVISGKGNRTAVAFDRDATAVTRLVVDADETLPESRLNVPELAYALKLYFGTPQPPSESTRVFDVRVQGQTVAKNVTLGGSGSSAVREMIVAVDRVMIGPFLDVELIPKEGSPVLSGIELRQLDQ